jgi:AraC-like DNA-binding protein
MTERNARPATLPIGALAAMPRLLAERHHDPLVLLGRFGISESSLADMRAQAPLALHGRVMDAAAKATGCPHFGLLLGATSSLENVGELRFLLLNAATVRQALDHLVRFAKLWHPAIRAERAHEGGFARLALTLAKDVPGADQVLLGYTVSIVKALRIVIGSAWSPTLVHLALHRPAQVAPYRRFFGGAVDFDQRDYAIFIPDATLDARRPGCDPRLAEFIFERLCSLESHAPGDLVGRVRDAIEAQLLRGRCDAQCVAELFTVHRKTLHGYLREAGTSFTRLREERREALAIRMLEHTDLPLAEIAAALGFEHQPSLTRAFKRWKGQAPSRWRNRSSGRPSVLRVAQRGARPRPR